MEGEVEDEDVDVEEGGEEGEGGEESDEGERASTLEDESNEEEVYADAEQGGAEETDEESEFGDSEGGSEAEEQAPPLSTESMEVAIGRMLSASLSTRAPQGHSPSPELQLWPPLPGLLAVPPPGADAPPSHAPLRGSASDTGALFTAPRRSSSTAYRSSTVYQSSTTQSSITTSSSSSNTANSSSSGSSANSSPDVRSEHTAQLPPSGQSGWQAAWQGQREVVGATVRLHLAESEKAHGADEWRERGRGRASGYREAVLGSSTGHEDGNPSRVRTGSSSTGDGTQEGVPVGSSSGGTRGGSEGGGEKGSGDRRRGSSRTGSSISPLVSTFSSPPSSSSSSSSILTQPAFPATAAPKPGSGRRQVSATGALNILQGLWGWGAAEGTEGGEQQQASPGCTGLSGILGWISGGSTGGEAAPTAQGVGGRAQAGARGEERSLRRSGAGQRPTTPGAAVGPGHQSPPPPAALPPLERLRSAQVSRPQAASALLPRAETHAFLGAETHALLGAETHAFLGARWDTPYTPGQAPQQPGIVARTGSRWDSALALAAQAAPAGSAPPPGATLSRRVGMERGEEPRDEGQSRRGRRAVAGPEAQAIRAAPEHARGLPGAGPGGRQTLAESPLGSPVAVASTSSGEGDSVVVFVGTPPQLLGQISEAQLPTLMHSLPSGAVTVLRRSDIPGLQGPFPLHQIPTLGPRAADAALQRLQSMGQAGMAAVPRGAGESVLCGRPSPGSSQGHALAHEEASGGRGGMSTSRMLGADTDGGRGVVAPSTGTGTGGMAAGTLESASESSTGRTARETDEEQRAVRQLDRTQSLNNTTPVHRTNALDADGEAGGERTQDHPAEDSEDDSPTEPLSLVSHRHCLLEAAPHVKAHEEVAILYESTGRTVLFSHSKCRPHRGLLSPESCVAHWEWLRFWSCPSTNGSRAPRQALHLQVIPIEAGIPQCWPLAS